MVLMVGIMLAGVLALSLVGCGDKDTGDPSTPFGGDGPFTVEFVANGGSPAPIPAIVTVEKGDTVTAPPDMSYNHEDFKGWYVSSTFAGSPYNFSTPITANLKLYAKWGYKVGDTGPAGGKIFYVKAGTVYPDPKYYEASPIELEKCRWVGNLLGEADDAGAVDYQVTGAFGTAIGTGQANTTAILAVPSLPQFTGQVSVPAASAANNYTVGIYGNWFLPSKDELNALHLSKVLSIYSGEHFYWSSSQHSDEGRIDCAWAQDFGDPEVFQTEENKGHNYRTYVRPVRSFFCCH